MKDLLHMPHLYGLTPAACIKRHLLNTPIKLMVSNLHRNQKRNNILITKGETLAKINVVHKVLSPQTLSNKHMKLRQMGAEAIYWCVVAQANVAWPQQELMHS